MRSKLLMLVLVGITAGPAFAAKKPVAPAQWEQEPDSFMGMRFDKKVDDVLPLCPSNGISETMCHDKPYQNSFLIRRGPPLDFGYGLTVFAGGDGIESFYMTAKSEDYASLSHLLISKYGAPTERWTEVVKTKGGAEFNDETLAWQGKKVVIFAHKYSGDINTSTVSIKTLVAAQRQAAEIERKTKEGASKL